MGTSVKSIKTTGSRHSKQRKRTMKSPIDKARPHEVVWNQVSDLFDAARTIGNPTFVYFIGEEDDSGPVKIGLAKDPVARVRTMQTGNSHRLRIEHVLVGDRVTEQLLHEMWRAFSLTAEWFRPDIRKLVYPIIASAAAAQTEHLLNTVGDLELVDLEQIIRDAHGEHDFVFMPIEAKRLLAQGAGYLPTRRSRI